MVPHEISAVSELAFLALTADHHHQTVTLPQWRKDLAEARSLRHWESFWPLLVLVLPLFRIHVAQSIAARDS